MEKIESNDIINLIPLDKATQEIAQQVIEETDLKKTKDLVAVFNLNQAKKNVLRILKLNNLLDKVSDQMIERFEKRPGEFSNSDLLNYLTVTQSSIDRANKSLNLVDEAPAITLNQVNINVEDTLNRESRGKVIDAVKALMAKLDKKEDESSNKLIESNNQESEIIIEEDNKLLNKEE